MIRPLDFLAWRNLSEHRLRTVLSALAVALGVMMVIAADVIGTAIQNAGEALEQSQSTSGIFASIIEQGLVAVGLVILAAASFVIFNAYAMAITQRRQQIGAMRSLGMTRRQVMRLVLLEAFITGGMGTLLGLVAGPLVGRGILALMGELAGVSYGKSPLSLLTVLVAAALGIGISLASVFFPARQATRISPLVALRQEMASAVEHYPRWLAAIGLLCAITAMAYLLIAPPGRWVVSPWDNVLTGVFALVWLVCLGLILPAVIGGLGVWGRKLLTRLWGTTGRLAADNLGRGRGRVTLTILTLVVGLTMIVSLTGFLTILIELQRTFFRAEDLPEAGWGMMPIDLMGSQGTIDIGSAVNLDFAAVRFSDEAYTDIRTTLGDRASYMELRAVIVPELAVITGSWTWVVNADELRALNLYTFYEGDWEHTVPIMDAGCGLMMTPGTARRNGVWLYDTLVVPGKDGPVECTVAALGTNFAMGTTLLSDVAGDAFGAPESAQGLFMVPKPGVDVIQFEADFDALAERYGLLAFSVTSSVDELFEPLDNALQVILNGPLVLAILAAALGVINTTAMSITERRQELGLLRAVGATRRQATRMVTVEAALMGVVGGLFGLVAGVGLVAIRVLIVDVSTWGVRVLDLWALAGAAIPPAVINGLVGLIIAPFVCAGAAWLPTRSILRGSAIETMDVMRQPEKTRRDARTSAMMRSWRIRPRYGANQITLVWRNLAANPLRSVLTALAISLGVGAVLAASIVGMAASESATAIAEEGPQVDLEVYSRYEGPFDSTVLDMLRASRDVEQASPSLRVEARGIDPDIESLTVMGVEPGTYADLYKPELANGAFLDGPDTIVLPMKIAIDHGLNVGDEIVLSTQHGDLTLTVAGRLKLEQDITALTEVNVAYVPLDVVQTLAGAPGQIDHVAIRLRPNVNPDEVRLDLAEQLGVKLAVVRSMQGVGLNITTGLVQLGLVMVGAIMLFAAAFVIMNAFAMSVTARMQEIGAQRAVGMTRRQVMRLMLTEAGLLGLFGSALGVAAGTLMAYGAMWLLGSLDEGTFAVPWWGVVLSAAMGLGVTLVGALQPARQASRVSPLVAMRPHGMKADSSWYVRRGGRAGLLILVILLTALAAVSLLLRPTFFVAMAITSVGQVGVLLAVILLLPALVNPVASLTRPLLVRWLGTSGRLAADNMERNKLRTVLTAGALTAGLTVIIATSGLLPLMLEGGLNNYIELFKEDGWITAFGPRFRTGEVSVANIVSEISNTTLDPGVLDAIQPLVEEGVIDVMRIGHTPIPDELAALTGYPGAFVDEDVFLRIGDFDFFEGDPETALDIMHSGPAVLLLPLPAERLGVHVGDAIPVQTPHGEVDFTVAGIGAAGINMPIFTYTDGETYFDLKGMGWIGIIVAEGQDVEAVFTRINELIEPFEEAEASTVADSSVVFFDVIGQFQTMLNVLLLLAVIVASLGVVNTMVINVTERRREIALLRAVGAAQRQVRQAVMAEAACLGVMAALIATALAVLMLAIFALVMTPGGTASMGFRVSWELAAEVLPIGLTHIGLAAVLSLILGPAVAALAASYPARQAAAMDVVEATRDEQVAVKPAKTARPERSRMTRALSWTMALRSLDQHQVRAVLVGLSVAMGVAVTVGADILVAGMLNALGSGSVMASFVSTIGSYLRSSGLIISLVAGFLVYNAFTMSVTQRQREIGALRALGMTRRQVTWLIVAEALLVGAAGTLVGLALGPLLGQALLTAIAQTGLDPGEAPASLTMVLVAALSGLAVSGVAAFGPARRAAHISPLTAIRDPEAVVEGGAGPLRTGLGLVLTAGLALYLVAAPPAHWAPKNSPWEWIMLAILWGVCLLAFGLLLPGLTGGLVRLCRRPLKALGGASGRMIVDNLRRAPQRVALMVLAFAIGLALVGWAGGQVDFVNGAVEFLAERYAREVSWFASPLDPMTGVAQLNSYDPESSQLDTDVVEDVRRAAEGQALVTESYMVLLPEISSPIPGFPSVIMDPAHLTTPGAFTFVEGNWETALPLMEQGCGVLVSSNVASRHQAGLGDVITIQGLDGPVDCTVAGVGSGGVPAMSIVGLGARDAFLPADQQPGTLNIRPLPGADLEALEADLEAVVQRHPGRLWISRAEEHYESIIKTSDQLRAVFNPMILLAVVAAALGVANTTMLNIVERQRELGLLRAVGATRRQITGMVVGEAALTGLVGALLGLGLGMAFTLVFGLTMGGTAFGVDDLPLWSHTLWAAFTSLRNGLMGLIASPLLAALAAYFPVRTLLRGSAIETMEPERQPQITVRQAMVGVLSRGSVRARFTLGAAVLMGVVLAGLITVVTAHARVRLEEQTHDALRTLVAWNAGMLELGMPDDAETLDLEAIQGGGALDFDSDALLRFETLVDDMTENGLVDFAIADRDNVVLISLDVRQTGALAPGLEVTDRADVYSEREDGKWLMYATAPVQNSEGMVIGSVRLVADAGEIQDFLNRLRGMLWAIGGVIIVAGLAITWAVSAPLIREAPARPERRFSVRLSLRARLTVAMVLIVTLMVGLLQLVAVPTERRHVESTLRDGLVAGTDWIGQVASDSFDAELADLSFEKLLSFDEILGMTQTLDLAQLQELTEQMQSDDMAYIALVDTEGTVVLSDQLALIGEPASVSSRTEVEGDLWRGEDIWVASTPLRRGRDGEQIGTLRMGVKRDRIEAFLGESRNLFRLSGLIAVLAGVLLAQAIGGAAAVPTEELTARARRIAAGDLKLQFDRRTNDELTILANAYNQMVLGLQEREWLHDMFGRFVSREVAEAIRTGRISLEGENRVVSVLFCDIRDFSELSGQYTPEEIVALLNEYLPVVVDAAQAHGGTVNKFGGESTLVVYGAPGELQESAYHALCTALQIREGLAQLNDWLTEHDYSPIRIGVGINTGVALAGAVGPVERQEYTVIGDTVNLASRIEALTGQYPDYDILVSGQTYDALRSRRAEFQFVDLGEVAIRGKAEVVGVRAVVGWAS